MQPLTWQLFDQSHTGQPFRLNPHSFSIINSYYKKPYSSLIYCLITTMYRAPVISLNTHESHVTQVVVRKHLYVCSAFITTKGGRTLITHKRNERTNSDGYQLIIEQKSRLRKKYFKQAVFEAFLKRHRHSNDYYLHGFKMIFLSEGGEELARISKSYFFKYFFAVKSHIFLYR